MKKNMPEHLRNKKHPVYGTSKYDGANGCFLVPHFKIADCILCCIVSDGDGWDHVSVTLLNTKHKDIQRCPNWEEMCFIKDVFFDKEEVVVQFHPAEFDYISNHPYCLHMWRNQVIGHVTPPSLMVGLKSINTETL